MEIELGRTFIDSLVAAHARGENVGTKVTMTKAWIPKMANIVAYRCTQLNGGYGYLEEYSSCRFTRDARGILSLPGRQVMQHILVKNMGFYSGVLQL